MMQIAQKFWIHFLPNQNIIEAKKQFVDAVKNCVTINGKNYVGLGNKIM